MTTTVDRAVVRLTCLGWHETDAYHLLRRTANNQGRTMERVAEDFLKRGYDALSYLAVRRTESSGSSTKGE